jgi:hypothetical protein
MMRCTARNNELNFLHGGGFSVAIVNHGNSTGRLHKREKGDSMADTSIARGIFSVF